MSEIVEEVNLANSKSIQIENESQCFPSFGYIKSAPNDQLERNQNISFSKAEQTPLKSSTKEFPEKKDEYSMQNKIEDFTESALLPCSNPETFAKGEKCGVVLSTRSYTLRHEKQRKEIERRREELRARSLERRMGADLERRNRELWQMRGKMDVLNDIRERRELMLVEQELKKKKQKEEFMFLHEANIKDFEMYRKMKKREYKKELKLSKELEQESLNNFKFNLFLKEKEKQKNLFVMKSKQEIKLKKFSDSKINTFMKKDWENMKFISSNTERLSRTSQSSRSHSSFIPRRQISISLYSGKNKMEGIENTVASTQKKYNNEVRKNGLCNFKFEELENNSEKKIIDVKTLLEEVKIE